MQITHLGHACLLVDVAGSRLLLDPGAFSTYADLTDLDAVLITHQHPDHVEVDKLSALLERNPAAVVHADPETTKILAEKEIPATATVVDESFHIGDVVIIPAGDKHAVINEYLPRIDNAGLLITAQDEPSLFHPGDALDAHPAGDVDVLAVPINAPWCAAKETVAFVRRIEPRVVVPIHDALLSDIGRTFYITQVGSFGREGGIEVKDLKGAGATDF